MTTAHKKKAPIGSTQKVSKNIPHGAENVNNEENMLDIAFGRNRSDTNWKNRKISWKEFVEMLRLPRRTSESMAEYDLMDKADRAKIKDGPGYVGGFVRGGRRKKENLESRSLIEFDIDNGEGFMGDYAPWMSGSCLDGIAYVINSTHSHRASKEKYRLNIPASRPMLPDEHSAVSRRMAERIGMGFMDKTTFDVNRFMYLPSCSADSGFIFEEAEGKPLDVDAILATYEDWRNPLEWPRHPQEQTDVSKHSGTLGDPRKNERYLIKAAFNTVYAIGAVIEKYLGEIYTDAGGCRYTFHGGSSSGGLQLFTLKDDPHYAAWAYSYQDSDPAADGYCKDSFGLVQAHLFGDSDEDENDKVRKDHFKSFKAMLELAEDDPEVFAVYQEMQDAQIEADFAEAVKTGTVNPKMFFDRSRFIPKKLSDWIKRTHHVIIVGKNADMYIYQDGVYTSNLEALRKAMATALSDKYSSFWVNEAIRHVQDTSDRISHDALLNAGDWLNVKNGMLDLKTYELHPHNPKFKSIIQLPVDYDPNADTSVFDAYARHCLPGDAIPVLEEAAGNILLPSMRFEKGVFLIGGGGNGKGTFITLLATMLGHSNVSSVSLHSLEDNRFSGAELYGKMANLNADISAKVLENSSMFKRLTSGDLIYAEKKNQQPFDFYNRAKPVYSANEMPVSRDNTDGYYRKLIIIRFPNKFTDKKLRAALFTPQVLSGFLLRALQGLRRLLNNGGFTESETVNRELDAYRSKSDTVARFIIECCETGDPNEMTGKQALYDAYKRMCEDWGNRSDNQANFNSKLQELLPSIKEDRNQPGGRKWRGIKIEEYEGF